MDGCQTEVTADAATEVTVAFVKQLDSHRQSDRHHRMLLVVLKVGKRYFLRSILSAIIDFKRYYRF